MIGRNLIIGVLCLFISTVALAQTGKVAGTITDEETGEPLPGVNVVLVGTDQGAATNENGNYTILNVNPGVYNLQASFIGYATITVEGITVNANLTTRRDFQMQSQAIAGQEVVVIAMEPVVKPDVSSNVANVSAVQIENIPVAGVSEAINLQAGIEPGLTIRGSGMDELQFVVNGMNLENPKDNQPLTNISYTAIDRYQVQTGGFNAEYGNVRSGVINVNLKQPGQQFNVDLLMRYHPPSKKYFGIYPTDPNAYWMRPRLDPEVAYEGTDNWDTWTRRQYPNWQGWNQLSQALMEN
ncbi:MAG TPA: TonB-dependent receptor, partial [bacterium]|nr:TonB-dependent receptor [bacterium]